MVDTTRNRIVTEQIFVNEMGTPGRAMRMAVEGLAGGSLSAYDKALSVTNIPLTLYSRRRYQQSAYNQDNVTTLMDGTQYAVVLSPVGAEQHWFLLKRAPLSKIWQQVDLALVSSGFNKIDPSDDDSHNVVNVAVSNDGHIHVVGNMHSQPMRYVRSGTPGDITTMAAQTISSTATTQVTYPMFFRGPSGKLFLFWRSGLATSGDFYLSSWSGASWSSPFKLLDGQSNGEGAYPHRIAVRAGKVAIFFLYRGSGDASTNKGMYYVESVDECSTWRRVNTSSQTVPITSSNGDRFQIIGEAAGLINQGGADIDENGHPHAAIQLYDSAGKTQLHHIWHDGTSWHDEQVTQWSQRIETVGQTTLDLTVARPHVFCHGLRTYFLARTSGEGFYGRPILIDVTPGADHDPVILADINLYGWEPAIDSRALVERDELNMLITSIDVNADSKRNWEAQWGGILSIKLDQLGLVQAGASKVPSIKTVHSFPAAADVTVAGGASSSTEVDASLLLNSAFLNPNAAYGPGTRFFARIVGRIDFKSGTTSAQFLLREKPSSGSLPSSDISRVVLANTTIQGYFETPWEPMPGTPFVETGGIIRGTNLVPIITADNIAGLRFRGFVIEIGILELP